MLLPLTVGFVAGLTLGSFLPLLPTTILAVLILLLATLVVLEGRGLLLPEKSHLFYGSLLVGVVYWTMATGDGKGARLLQAAGEGPVRITGRVVEPVRQAPGRMVLVVGDLTIEHQSGAEPVEGRLRVTWRKPDRSLGQGDRISLVGRVREPAGLVNPGGFHYEAFLERKGIEAVLSLSGPGQVLLLARPLSLSRWGWWRNVDDWRDRIRRAAIADLTGPALGLFIGLMIGEQGYIDPEVRDAFMVTGTVHILSISGSHLGLVALLGFVGIKQACRALPSAWLLSLSRHVTSTRLAALGTVIPVTFYTLLAGSDIATVRALIMILVFLLAVWLGRAEQLLLALAAAALLILGLDPQALYDISFQLSFLSVLTIALLVHWYLRKEEDREAEADPSYSPFRRMASAWIKPFALVTGGVTLATLPLVAYYFNQIAWMGLVCNFLVVPLAGVLLVPLGLVSVLWLLVSGGETLPLAFLQQSLLDWSVQLVRWMARMPGGEWHVASPPIPAILAYFALLVVAGRPGGKYWIRWGCAMGALLLLLWWGWSPRQAPEKSSVRVTFLDVGQGDACLIELPDGQTVLIDAGAQYDQLDMGRAVVGPYLWDLGIRRLDHVIGTHPQLDHIGGLPWILEKFEVGRFWSNGVPREEPFYQRLLHALQNTRVTESKALQGIPILEAGGCRMVVLNPPPEGRGAESAINQPSSLISSASTGTKLNNASVVTQLDCGPHSFLFAADLETEGLLRMKDPAASQPIQVVKVPHHGARSSLAPAWIHTLKPEVAVISVGRRNPYGHPSPQVLAAYAQEEARLYRTDRDGAVVVTGSLADRGLVVRTARSAFPQNVHIGTGLWHQESRNVTLMWRQWLGP